jgi:hypothetical protein
MDGSDIVPSEVINAAWESMLLAPLEYFNMCKESLDTGFIAGLYILFLIYVIIIMLNYSICLFLDARMVTVFDRPKYTQKRSFFKNDEKIMDTINKYQRFFKEFPRTDVWNYFQDDSM